MNTFLPLSYLERDVNAPESFIKSLERQFDGRLRVRWSNAQQGWEIEQRVGPHREAPIDENDDDLVRARDGYAAFMSIRPGTRMPCPECRFELKVPVFHTEELMCPYCKMMGRTTSVNAGFFELNDRLLEHLRQCDPDRGGSQRLKEMADRNNEALWRSQLAAAMREGRAAASERYNRIVGIQQVGWTGKEFKKVA